MAHFDIVIIGAGVVGLAAAEALSGEGRRVLLLEKNDSFGRETSSRNSEVIHAGIYYPEGFLKAAFCREGNRLLYETCQKRDVPHRRTGKLIVAVNDEEGGELEAIRARAERNGVDDLRFLARQEIRKLEPAVKAVAALLSPSTGIIDSHRLMRSFYLGAEAAGTMAAFRSEVTAIRFDGRRYEVEINGGEYRLQTPVVINSAGLQSDRIAALAGIDIDGKGYRLKFCKGDYFSASPSPKLEHLVYPVPAKNREGLGIHATLDLQGRVRFGPDTEYVDGPDYAVKEEKKAVFYEAVRTYLPDLRPEQLGPDTSGIRPKLQGPGESYRDFVICDEKDAGFPGFINLIGIESPGLTSCIPIAQYVRTLIQPYL